MVAILESAGAIVLIVLALIFTFLLPVFYLLVRVAGGVLLGVIVVSVAVIFLVVEPEFAWSVNAFLICV